MSKSSSEKYFAAECTSLSEGDFQALLNKSKANIEATTWEGTYQLVLLPKKGSLTTQQKNWNTKLLEMQVIVGSSICTIKIFKILLSVYCHWRGGHGQININDVAQVCVPLTNQKI